MNETLIATLAAVGALTAVAAPAAAQPYGYDSGRYERGYDSRYDNGRYDNGRYDNGRYDNGRYDRWNQRSLGRIALNRVDRAIEDRRLSPWEARRLRAEAFDLYQTEARIGGNGMDWRERQMIRDRFQSLMARLDRDIHDRDYGSGYYR
jgi:hypothetical protein